MCWCGVTSWHRSWRRENIQLALVDEACGKGFYWTPLTDAPPGGGGAAGFCLGGGDHLSGAAAAGAVSLLSGAVCGRLLPQDATRVEVTASDDGAILSHGGRRPGCISAVRLFSGGLRGPGAGDPADAAGVPATGRGGEGPSGCQHSSKIFPVVPEAAICRSVT